METMLQRPRRRIRAGPSRNESMSDGQADALPPRGLQRDPSPPYQRANIWIAEQETMLKDWAEIASSCAWMHNKAHNMFHRRNLYFQLPVIILSTLTGTANFAQASMPLSWGFYMPMVIGLVNIFAGVLTTMAQFLRVSELSEGHRIATISYAKLSRNIRTELALPSVDRTVGGHEFLKSCRMEMDRLYEQCPEIPLDIVYSFGKKIGKHPELAKPEIIQIRPARIWVPGEMEQQVLAYAEANRKLQQKIAQDIQAGIESKKQAKKHKGEGIVITDRTNAVTSESSSPIIHTGSAKPGYMPALRPVDDKSTDSSDDEDTGPPLPREIRIELANSTLYPTTSTSRVATPLPSVTL